MNIQNILKKTIDELKFSLGNSNRKVILILSITYLITANGFYLSQKITTGRFFYHYTVGIITCSLSIICGFTAIYYYLLLKNKTIPFFKKIDKRLLPFNIEEILKCIIASLLMVYCSLVMSGYGNISSDTLLFDFSLGHAFIFIVSILLGRTAAIAWSVVVIVILCYVTFTNQYSHSFNFLTPNESNVYESALKSNKKWALDRQKILTENHLNTPKKTKYFIQWFFSLIVAAVIAYYFNGVSFQIFKIIPRVSKELENAIEKSINTEKEHINKLNEIEGQKLLLKQEALKSELDFLKSQINPHFLYNTLNYFYIKTYEHSEELAESIRMLSDIMKYSMKTTGESFTNLHEEISHVKMLIDLHQIRYEHKLYINLEIKGDEPLIQSKKIIPSSFITLVENAFKHGKLNDQQYPLRIKIKILPKEIMFNVQNKKNNAKNRFDSTKFGLSNLKNRLELAYQSKYHLEIKEDTLIYECKLVIYT